MTTTPTHNLELLTIGVYGFSEVSFFQTLIDARIDTFCDIRRRRGMRGSDYAFVNSARLQHRLGELGIRYVHLLDLAPPQAIRDIQDADAAATGIAKRSRTRLSERYIQGYRQACLANFDLAAFTAAIGDQAKRVCLFCVEREPAACHRSLAADHIAAILRTEVTHLMP